MSITADEAGFPGTEHAGIRLFELEDGLYTHAAYGHHDAAEMAAALHAYVAESVRAAGEVTGSDASWWDAVPADDPREVERRWAILEHHGDDDDEGWFYRWDEVTEDMDGAFPVTLVPD